MTDGQGGSSSSDLAALAPPSTGAAGWYRDPAPGAGAFGRRYYDGERWTEQVSGTDPTAPGAAGATTATRPAPPYAPGSPSWSALPPPSQVGVPIGTQHRRRAPWVVLGVVVAVVAAGAGLVATGAFGGGPDHPSAWDSRVEPIAEEVARLRELDYEHPVPVRFLADKEFRTYFEAPEDEESVKEAADAVRELRAVGLVVGDVDLNEAVEAEQQSGVLAFYSPDDEEILVRGERLTPAVEVTLAHELTHVLQDQHFDLDATGERVRDDPNGSFDAFRGLYEGDANRIEEEYEEGMSDEDRAAIDSERDDDFDRIEAETADVPFVVELVFGAPYAFGPSVVDVIVADGGNRALDRVFEEPTFTQMIFVDPASALEAPVERPVRDPKPAKGERRIGDVDAFGALDAFITLGARIDPVVAFDAASGWAGGRIATVRRDDTTCVRIALRGADERATGRLADAFTTWAGAHPAGSPEVGATDARVDVVACDPGPAAAGSSPDSALESAAGLLQLHAAIESGLIGAEAPVSLARCTASEALRVPEVRGLLAQPEDELTRERVDDVLGRSVAAAALACRQQLLAD